MTTLTANKNIYDGIEIDPLHLPDDEQTFHSNLQYSLGIWQRESIKVVWLLVPQRLAKLIPTAVELGFDFHHSNQDGLMLTKRLVKDAEVPHFATHTIGAGGVVINSNNEILTIVERLSLKTKPNHFKFPGGMLEKGELISEGVVREVFEETGVRTEFKGLISFRHHHAGQFGTSNIYALALLTPLSHEITMDEEEIGKAQWMPLDEYLAMDTVAEFNKQVIRSVLASDLLHSVKLETYMQGNKDAYEIYLPQSDLQPLDNF